jgi:hypothetical protein
MQPASINAVNPIAAVRQANTSIGSSSQSLAASCFELQKRSIESSCSVAFMRSRGNSSADYAHVRLAGLTEPVGRNPQDQFRAAMFRRSVPSPWDAIAAPALWC